ncbi:unnamed protein product [Dovyalis caffra]|uniref:Transcription factor TFIIB cyclin-like domain-containing protein n=1 Tax=Dovyalis caffra TaxID=77055 RepID=A0AAV1SSZ3_9ROSI|nr:unnamed protein product [Dovyalis caffra]
MLHCGLVLESHYIDEVSEWRIFSDGSSNKDPNRVDESSNILSSGINLSTFISASKGSKNDILKLHIREQDPDKALFHGFRAINTMADRLNIVEAIRVRANEILTKMEEQKSRTVKNQQALSTACLFIACRENKLLRTLKEIRSATFGFTMKQVNKAAQLIRKQLGLDMGATDTSELVRRFCYNLGMKGIP